MLASAQAQQYVYHCCGARRHSQHLICGFNHEQQGCRNSTGNDDSVVEIHPHRHSRRKNLLEEGQMKTLPQGFHSLVAVVQRYRCTHAAPS